MRPLSVRHNRVVHQRTSERTKWEASAENPRAFVRGQGQVVIQARGQHAVAGSMLPLPVSAWRTRAWVIGLVWTSRTRQLFAAIGTGQVYARAPSHVE